MGVVAFGILSALAWGSADFGGGLVSRRAPLFGVVAGSLTVGIVAALLVAIARGEPVPQGMDLVWSALAGIAGVVGITCLYRGLAVGRMGVVAPTTGVLAAVVPVVVGFASEGVPGAETIAGIVTALVAVVLVTRAPSHDDGRPSGLAWALLAGLGLGAFNVCVGQLSGAGALAPLVVIRMVEAIAIGFLIVGTRQPWRIEGRVLPRVVAVGLLDMTGNAAFILATQSGALAIAAVLSSMYPVVTVLLAIAVLRERLTRSHLAGVALTAVAIALIAAGSISS